MDRARSRRVDVERLLPLLYELTRIDSVLRSASTEHAGRQVAADEFHEIRRLMHRLACDPILVIVLWPIRRPVVVDPSPQR